MEDRQVFKIKGKDFDWMQVRIKELEARIAELESQLAAQREQIERLLTEAAHS